jgi:hypothetical protein
VATERGRDVERRHLQRRVNPGASIDVTRHEHENLLQLVEQLAKRVEQLEREFGAVRIRLERVDRAK